MIVKISEKSNIWIDMKLTKHAIRENIIIIIIIL